MNGAESLVRTLVAGGVNVCFANPGTSEMHFVAALDRVEGMRCVLGLFEGVVTGAADGYYRMKGTPASTLLHLGPGLAQRPRQPAQRQEGAFRHRQHRRPARDLPHRAQRAPDLRHRRAGAADVGMGANLAGRQVGLGRRRRGDRRRQRFPAADRHLDPAGRYRLERGRRHRAGAGAKAAAAASRPRPSRRPPRCCTRAATPTYLLVTGGALTEKALALAQQIAGKTGCKVMGQTYHPRMARGRGRFSIDRIPYVIESALPILKNFKNIILVEARDPVAFFAYPNKPSMLKPEGCEVHQMTSWGENSVAALEALADSLGAKPADVKPQKLTELNKPTGALNHASIAQAIACAIPENAIIVDESITTGRGFFPPTAASAPHDWLQNMGGSIGFSTPVATGAAVACPDRKVICMVGDGSAMYTIQSLWTQAREGLNVVTIVFANRIYQILRGEFDGVGAGEPGQRAQDMLKLDRPTIDFVALAKGMGVEGRAVTTADDFNKALAEAIAAPGPRLIEVQF